MPNVWSAPTSWAEVCQRVGGRRRYHSVRRLRARLRRHRVARCLAREGLGYGVRARLARTLGVSKATITSDVRAILAMRVEDVSRPRPYRVRQVVAPAQKEAPPCVKEQTMGIRCTVRLPEGLHARLQLAADGRNGGASDVIREALGRHLGFGDDKGAEPPGARGTLPFVTPPPHDCAESVLARLPREVREGIVERARVLELPVSSVVTSRLIVPSPPSQPSLQGPSTARPQKDMLTWQEFKRRRQQGSDVALSDTTPSSAASALGISPPPTAGSPSTQSPAALGSSPPSA